MLKMFMVLAISAIAMSILALQKRPNCTKAVILPVVVLLMVSLTGCSDVSGYSNPWGEFYGPYGYAAARAQFNLASEEQKKNNNEDATNEAISEDVSEDEDVSESTDEDTNSETISEDVGEDEDVSESTDEDTNSETISEDVGEDEDAQDSAGKDHRICLTLPDGTQRWVIITPQGHSEICFYFDGQQVDDKATGWQLYYDYPNEERVANYIDGKIIIQISSLGRARLLPRKSTSYTHPEVGGFVTTYGVAGGATGDYQPDDPSEQCVDRSISAKHDDYDVDY